VPSSSTPCPPRATPRTLPLFGSPTRCTSAQARGISTVVKPTSAASIGDIGRLKAEKGALEDKLEAAQQALREMREHMQQGMHRSSEGALGRGANPHASTNPGKPGQLAKQNSFAVDKHLHELRELKLAKTHVTTDDLAEVMRGALSEALGSDTDATKQALAAALQNLARSNPADMRATFPGEALGLKWSRRPCVRTAPRLPPWTNCTLDSPTAVGICLAGCRSPRL